MSGRGPTTSALITAAKAHDRDAAERLFVAFYPRVLRLVEVRLGRRLRQHYEPADIAQSVFGRAYRGLPRFEDRGPGSFAAWLDQITERTILDKARWLAAAKRADDSSGCRPVEDRPAPSSAGPSREARKREDIEELHGAMKALNPRERRVIELRLFLGLRGTQVSDALGVSHEAARKIYARALKKVKAGIPSRGEIP